MPPASLLPGPADVHPEVLAAMARPIPDAGSEEMGRLLASVDAPLRTLFRTARPVLLGAASTTGFMEAAIRCGVRERVLVVVGGRHGARFARVAEACGKEVIRAMVHPGRTLEADHLQQFLDGPEVDAVALVHAETSTGALAPLAELARVVRARKDVILLVDAAGSVGGSPVETDAWGLDFVFCGSEKALGLPPGLVLGAVSQRFQDRAKTTEGRGYYFDLLRLEARLAANRTSTALPVSLVHALEAQLARIAAAGGIETRWKRHHEMLTAMEEWVLLRNDVEMLAPAGRRAWTVSCLRLPPGWTGSGMVAALRERGWLVGPGWGSLEPSTIRIGHLGDVDARRLQGLLVELEGLLAATTPPS